jgi:hypothetical protein
MKSVVEDAVVIDKPAAGVILQVQLTSCIETGPINIKNGPNAGGTFTKLDWKFKVVDGMYEGLVLSGKTGSELSVHPENDYRHYAEALLQQPLDLGQPLDTDDLLGLVADALVIHEAYTKNGVEKVAVKIGQLLKADFDRPSF